MQANTTLGRLSGAVPAFGGLLLVLAMSVGGAAGATEQDARAILKAMSDYMADQKTISLTFDSDIEVITSQMEKLQFTNSGEMLMRRPDKLRAKRVGGYVDAELTFDGKAASILSRQLNAYFQADAPGTIDQLLEALRAGHGVSMPGGDLMISRPYDTLIADVMEAKHIGTGIIDGVRCEHLAFRNVETDWQIWIEAGDRPVPRKLVITSKTLNSAPQYTLRIKTWKSGEPIADDAFVFVPPKDAGRLAAEDLTQLDELPEGAPVR